MLPLLVAHHELPQLGISQMSNEDACMGGRAWRADSDERAGKTVETTVRGLRLPIGKSGACHAGSEAAYGPVGVGSHGVCLNDPAA